jgi:H-type lectin domain
MANISTLNGHLLLHTDRTDLASSPHTSLSVNRTDADVPNPLAQISMFGEGTNNLQGVLSFVTMNSGNANGPLEERMRIHTNGNVGIGTTAPTQRLEVAGTVKAEALQGNGLVVGTNQLTVVAGNVGIGTPSPSAKLDVKGAVRAGCYDRGPASVNAYSLEIGGTDPGQDSGRATIYLHHHGKVAHQLRYNSGTLFLEGTQTGYGTTDTPNLVIGGNVGIGITAPQAQCHVNGNMRLQAGGPINEFSTDGKLSGNSDAAVPTEKAVKTYIDNFVQSGRHGAGVGAPGWNLRDGTGERTFKQRITFARSFSSAPKVMIGLVTFDFETIKNQRINVYTQNITASYFDVFFTTWSDTKCWSVTVEWLAYGP